MKKLLSLIVLSLSLGVFAFAEDEPKFAVEYIFVPTEDVRHYKTITYDLFRFEDLFGVKDLSPNVITFAGYNSTSSSAGTGFGLSFSSPLAKNATIDYGPALVFEDGRKPAGVIYVGLSLGF